MGLDIFFFRYSQNIYRRILIKVIMPQIYKKNPEKVSLIINDNKTEYLMLNK